MGQELIAAWIDKTLKYQFEDKSLQEDKTPQEKLLELIKDFVGVENN